MTVSFASTVEDCGTPRQCATCLLDYLPTVSLPLDEQGKYMSTPARLYKYRSFSVLSLRMITEAEVFYAQPKTFNDPLDCNPSFEANIGRLELEKTLYRLLRARMLKEDALKEIDYNRYMSTEYGDYRTEPKVDEGLKRNVAYQIEREINRQLGVQGVLSFSQTWRSGLMWSHYADEHRGFCIEYDTTDMAHPNLAPVNYRAPRAIKASDLYAWKLENDDAAKKRVLDTYFYSKSPEWRYEKEWRDITPDHGLKGVEYRMSAIHFGMRCDRSVMSSIVKLLDDNDDIDLYAVYPRKTTFRLTRELVDRDEMAALAIREPGFLMFKKFDEAEPSPILAEPLNDDSDPT
jgi:hypothetical protein